jgi:hypothetical protein
VLDQHDKEWLDGRYVKKDDCNEIMNAVNKKFSNDDTRIRLFEQKLSHWEKLFGVIATATVGQLIATVMQFILKG